MSQKDLEYYERRIREERAAAERTSGIAALCHEELADRYEALIQQSRAIEPVRRQVRLAL